MLGKLSESLKSAINRISSAILVDKKLIDEVVREIQRALLSSDVNVKLVFELSKRIKERAISEKLPPGLNKKQHVARIVYDELLGILGETKKVELKPQKILLLGLYGSGKTTTTAKIARYFIKKGLKPTVISTDTWRPAAYEQLRQLGEKLNIPVLGDPSEKNAAKLLLDSLAKTNPGGVTIVDSAGRDTIEEGLVREIKEVSGILNPDEKWLVLSGDIGQKAGDIARQFNEYVGLTGVIVTKMEGTAKGGGALSAVAQVKQPVVFIGVGEKTEDLEEFDPNRFLQRMLGFGDIKALMEKVQEVAEEEEMDPEEMLREEYTLKTFYKQLKAQKKMGPLKNIFQMMGVPMNIPDDLLKTGEERLQKYKYMMDSMTPQELKEPDVITHERMARISKGSGTKESEVKQLLSDFGKSKKLVNMFKKGKLPRQFRHLMGSMKE